MANSRVAACFTLSWIPSDNGNDYRFVQLIHDNLGGQQWAASNRRTEEGRSVGRPAILTFFLLSAEMSLPFPTLPLITLLSAQAGALKAAANLPALWTIKF